MSKRSRLVLVPDTDSIEGACIVGSLCRRSLDGPLTKSAHGRDPSASTSSDESQQLPPRKETNVTCFPPSIFPAFIFLLIEHTIFEILGFGEPDHWNGTGGQTDGQSHTGRNNS